MMDSSTQSQTPSLENAKNLVLLSLFVCFLQVILSVVFSQILCYIEITEKPFCFSIPYLGNHN